MTDDALIADKERAEQEAHRNARAANLFDLRRFIGGVFLLYGLILFILGFGASDADVEKAAGVNINLWTGLAMLIVGAIFVAWALLRPLSAELGDERAPEAGGAGAGGDGERASAAGGAGAGGDGERA